MTPKYSFSEYFQGWILLLGDLKWSIWCKFIQYNKFNSGLCTKINMIKSHFTIASSKDLNWLKPK